MLSKLFTVKMIIATIILIIGLAALIYYGSRPRFTEIIAQDGQSAMVVACTIHGDCHKAAKNQCGSDINVINFVEEQRLQSILIPMIVGNQTILMPHMVTVYNGRLIYRCK